MQHEVERHAGVGEDHALDRRVADVALVPERLVLERRRRVAAHHAREAGDVLEPPRVALVRHRRRALLARAELLLHLAHLGAREVAQLDGDLLAARRAISASAPMNAAWRSRCTTCVAAGSKPMPSRAQTASSTAGGRCANVPTAPEILPTAASSSARASRTPWRRISSANTSSLSPKVVGSACTPWVRPMHGRVLELARARARARGAARSTPASSSAPGVADLERERGVEHVARRHAVVHEARVGPDRTRPASVRNAITSWRTRSSISAMRAGSNRRLGADRRERGARDQAAFRDAPRTRRARPRASARSFPSSDKIADHLGPRVALDHRAQSSALQEDGERASGSTSRESRAAASRSGRGCRPCPAASRRRPSPARRA